MSLDIILNELSLRATAVNVYDARARMKQLIYTIRKATQYGMSRVVRSTAHLNAIDLALDYNVGRWRNDPQVDREVRRYFSSLTAKVPLLNHDEVVEDLRVSECSCNGERAEGLALALFWGTLSVSIASSLRWQADNIEVAVTVLNEDGELDSYIRHVRHAASPTHVDNHATWIDQQRDLSVLDGDDLWERRTELFPHLRFCFEVEWQIRSVASGSTLPVHSLIKLLRDLELYFAKWKDGPFDPGGIGRLVTQEGAATLAKYSADRTFRCPDGTLRLFSWHARLTPGAWRLYFFPDAATRACIVGYVGPHLKTVKYN